MVWLTVWLKKIILLVLLAAFLDLILPNTSMQRYVKMVMGLIILLTILSPVFSLFNLSQEELALKLDRYQERFGQPADDGWKAMTDRLLAHQNEQVTQYVEKEMKETIQAQVKHDFGLEISAVEVNFDQQTGEKPSVSSIVLTFGQEKPNKPSGNGIKPIKPVEIKLGNQASSKEEAKEVSAAVTENPKYREIASSVAQQWNIRPDQVEIHDESLHAKPQ